MSKYRTHTCGELSKNNKDKNVILSGWINKKRDHGNLLFIDIRDNYGLTQCVIDKDNSNFKEIEKLPLETVIQIDGKVIERSKETINPELSTGEIEVSIINFKVLGKTKELPLPVFSDQEYSEEIRLKYRFLDLRRKKIHQNIILRSKIITFIRSEMEKLGFLEFQTPILTSSSPEGARDFLVPSRLNPGKFFALPQAPQQFKQLFMIAGFGGSGKSSLSVLLGITGAHHLKSFMGRDVSCPFSTLIMNQEDTMDQLRLKASAYKKHFKLTKPVFQGEIFENTDQKICDITNRDRKLREK